jgi:hypothetical protein
MRGFHDHLIRFHEANMFPVVQLSPAAKQVYVGEVWAVIDKTVRMEVEFACTNRGLPKESWRHIRRNRIFTPAHGSFRIAAHHTKTK